MQTPARRQPAAFTVDHVETESLDDEQREHAVNALASLINDWNEFQRHTQN